MSIFDSVTEQSTRGEAVPMAELVGSTSTETQNHVGKVGFSLIARSDDLDSPRRRWHLSVLLIAIWSIALILRLNEASRTSDLVHPDEIFQTLEPAHRLAYGYGVVTWEWRTGVRSWVFPALLAGIMKATAWLSQGSTGYLLSIRFLLSFFSLVSVWFAYSWAKRVSGTEAAMIGAGMSAVWYELVVFAPSALTEVVASHCLLPGLYVGMYGDHFSEKKRMLLVGVCCGLAMSLRIQLAPAVLFAIAYFCYHNWRERWAPLTLGLSMPLLAFGVVDWITWSHPFHSFYAYFWVNLIEGRSTAYGIQPSYWYLLVLISHLGPIMILCLMGARKSIFLNWLSMLILIPHSLVPHKEVRFLYPLIPLLLTLAAVGLGDFIKHHIAGRILSPNATVFASLCMSVALCQFMQSRFSYWMKDSGAMTSLSFLSYDRSLCGLGLSGVRWFNIGGYTHLHQNVPIVVLKDSRTELSSVNAILTDRGIDINGFELDRCWNEVCLYRSRAPCLDGPGEGELNNSLEKTGN